MQVPIRLRRKTRDHAASMLITCNILLNYVGDKVSSYRTTRSISIYISENDLNESDESDDDEFDGVLQ